MLVQLSCRLYKLCMGRVVVVVVGGRWGGEGGNTPVSTVYTV